MVTYAATIEWEIDEADDPLHAAAQAWNRIRDSPGPVVIVRDEQSGASFDVDLLTSETAPR